MTKAEFGKQLEDLGFTKQKFAEYHNTVYENEDYEYKHRKMSLEIFVDHYNVRVVWWHQKGKKVTKCYSVFNEIANYKEIHALLADFFDEMIVLYKI